MLTSFVHQWKNFWRNRNACTRILLLENGVLIKDIQNEENTLKELADYFKV